MTEESKATVPASRAMVIKDTASNRHALVSRFGNEFSAALSPTQFIGLSNVYGLNPFVSHCAVIHGRFYIERDGWMHLIQREAKGELVDVDTRQATPAEYEAYRVPADDFFAIATVVREYPNGKRCPFTRRAIITKAQVQATENETAARGRGSKARHIVEDPWDMVEKQALVRALRMGFSDCLRRLEAAGDVVIEGVQVDKGTGELLEGDLTKEPSGNGAWARLWAIARDGGMDREQVHDFFHVPDREGVLKDYAVDRANNAKQELVQVVSDMADELEASIRGQQPEPEQGSPEAHGVDPAAQEARAVAESMEAEAEGEGDGGPE